MAAVTTKLSENNNGDRFVDFVVVTDDDGFQSPLNSPNGASTVFMLEKCAIELKRRLDLCGFVPIVVDL